MRVGLLPGDLTAEGGPSTYVQGFVQALGETHPAIEMRTLLLGGAQAGGKGRAQRDQVTLKLNTSGNVAVRGRPLSLRFHKSVPYALMPSYDLLFGRHDVYHQTHLDLNPKVSNDRLVLTLHDLIAEHWPDEGRLLPEAERLLQRAAAVITVSSVSKGVILGRFPSIQPDNVHVVWNGVDQGSFNEKSNASDQSMLKELGIVGRYLLYAGGLTQRKNLSALIEAYQILRYQLEDVPELVLIGPWKRERLAHLRASNSGVLPLGEVSMGAVPALMRGANAVVLPSREEGFGLPLLEAQACGTLVVCSNIAAFREIGGPSPFYLDTSEPRALAAGVQMALAISSSEKAMRIGLGCEHVKSFTWRRSAAKHADIYQAVINSRSYKQN